MVPDIIAANAEIARVNDERSRLEIENTRLSRMYEDAWRIEDEQRQRADAAERERDALRAEYARSMTNHERHKNECSEAIFQRDRRIAELEAAARHVIQTSAALGLKIRFATLEEALSSSASPATAGHIPGQVCEGGCSMKCVKKPGVSLDTHPHVGKGAVWGCTCVTEPQHDTVIRWNPKCDLHGDKP